MRAQNIITLYVFTFLIVLFYNQADAQIYPINNYSVKEGLVNSNVYFVASDYSGFVWMGTENGLSRYDGVEFDNRTISELGISSDIISIASFGKKEIIFGTESSGIYRLKTGADKAIKINTDQVSRADEILINDSLVILLNEYRRLEFISIKTGRIVAVDSLAHFDGCDIPIAIKKLKNGDVLIGRTSGLYRLKGYSCLKINTGIYSDQSVYSISEDDSTNIIVGTDNAIYKLEVSGTVRTIYEKNEGNERIRNVIVDNNGNYWFNIWGTSQLKMIQKGAIVDVAALSGGINASITRIHKNYDGSIWIGTLGKGIYKFDGRILLNYPFNSGLKNPNIHKLMSANNGVLMGTSDGLAFLDVKSNTIVFKKYFPDIAEYVRDIIQIGKSEYLVGITDQKLIDPFKKYDFVDGNISIRFVQSSGLLIDNNYLLAANWDNRYLKYKLPEYSFMEYVGPLLPEFNYNLRINALHYDVFGNMWVGSKHGLRVIDEQKNFKANIYSDINKYEVFKIYDYAGDTLYAVTSNGLYILKTNSNISECRLISNVVVPSTNCVLQTGTNEFLFGTTEGLVFIKDNFRKNLTVHDGLLSNIIEDFLYDDSSQDVFIASAEGLMKLDLVQLRMLMNTTPEVMYAELSQGAMKFSPDLEVANLNYNDGAFGLMFRAFNFQNPRELNYQYRVDNGDWNEAAGGKVQFASVSPGEHSIEVRAGLSGLSWGSVTSIPVHIIPPFYRTWWFYTLLIILSIGLIAGFYYQQIKLYRRKQDEKSAIKQKLVELQQKALASTLNPHFVFNSLNSIQHFINSSNNRDANIYLAKFSRLMRMHLDMADKSYISIYEEISRLEYYLNLEQMRFGERLIWKIDVDSGLDQNATEIPNMIIQPFVENAIWHGIMPSENKGEVMIGIHKSSDDCIHITVRDNGVGYGVSKNNDNRDHESKGVELIRERLMLLDGSSKGTLTFTNLTPGTLVEVVLSSKMYRTIQSLDPVFP